MGKIRKNIGKKSYFGMNTMKITEYTIIIILKYNVYLL